MGSLQIKSVKNSQDYFSPTLERRLTHSFFLTLTSQDKVINSINNTSELPEVSQANQKINVY